MLRYFVQFFVALDLVHVCKRLVKDNLVSDIVVSLLIIFNFLDGNHDWDLVSECHFVTFSCLRNSVTKFIVSVKSASRPA